MRAIGGGNRLLQLRVLPLGFFQDGDVRVGIFPGSEEILISGASFRAVSGQSIAAAQAKPGECDVWRGTISCPMLNDLLELGRGLGALFVAEVGQAAKISGHSILDESQFISLSGMKFFEGLGGVPALQLDSGANLWNVGFLREAVQRIILIQLRSRRLGFLRNSAGRVGNRSRYRPSPAAPESCPLAAASLTVPV